MNKLAQNPSPASALIAEEIGLFKPAVNKLSSMALFGGAKELVIDHAGQEYRLRQTSQGKLILTK
jgi:hemin uptake protein HemP